MRIKLMTHNIWGSFAPDVVHKVSNRAMLMDRIYRRELPDVIGMQEYSVAIKEKGLKEMISDNYSEIDIEELYKKEGVKNLYTPIFYRRTTVEPIKVDFILFDRAYNNSDSKGAAFAVFRHLESGEIFTVCNTHYWWKWGEEHDRARVLNSKAILERIADMPKPYFVMGDLNCVISSDAFKALLDGGMSDIQAVAKDSMDVGTEHSYPDYDEEKDIFYGAPKSPYGYDRAIDHLLVDSEHKDGAKVFKVLLDDDSCNTSDHCPTYIIYESEAK